MLKEKLVSDRQVHNQKKESTRSITYRLPEKLVNESDRPELQVSLDGP